MEGWIDGRVPESLMKVAMPYKSIYEISLPVGKNSVSTPSILFF
jgi:hypothetical protein